MGLADRDYMHERHRAAARRDEERANAPNWKTAAVAVLTIAAVSWVLYRLLGGGPAVPFPGTGQVLWYVPLPSDQRSTAPLTIAAPAHPQRNYAVKLSEWQSGRTVALIPVRAGEVTHLQVPLGEYQVTLSSGKTWRGPEKLFGPNGDIRKAVASMHFYRSGDQQIGHRIDLAQRPDGNMQTRAISPFENH